MAFPSTIASLPDPQASDKLNNPSHSALHQSENTEIEAIETFIGTTNASAVGTLIYDIRSPLSNGGGHVQTANKGGTGQITYAKGDILVATSASVLSKLAVGTNGQIIAANSSTASGINWVNNQTNKIANSASVQTIFASIISQNPSILSEQSVMSVVIPGSVLSTSNGVRARIFMGNVFFDGTQYSMTVRGRYGATSFASTAIASVTSANGSAVGVIELNLIGNGSVASQRGFLQTDLAKGALTYSASSFIGMKTYRMGPTLEDSSADKVLGLTIQYNNANYGSGTINNLVQVDGYTVEKIV